jgi:sarcosine oxidase
VSHHFEVIVVGVGGMGSAACYHLARRGVRTLGLERYGIPHPFGSSHGETRIIRLAYSEHPDYVVLLRRAFTLWRELETVADERLLHVTGSIDAGAPGSWVFEGSVRSCIEHGLDHEILDGAELYRRYPGYRFSDDTMACFQPDGGFLLPERCIVAHAEAALAAGAEVHGHEPVIGWEPDGSGVAVRTERATYRADRLVLSAGAWMGQLAAPLAPVVAPERQVLGWFQPLDPALFGPARFPVFNVEVDSGRFYGVPIFGIPGVKLGRYHHRGQLGVPEQLRAEEPGPEDELVLRQFLDRYLPRASGPTLSLRTCLFTNTADEHFVVDLHPELPQVVLASPCSGHGFKFASVMGEVLADLATTGGTRHAIELFRLNRLQAVGGPAGQDAAQSS